MSSPQQLADRAAALGMVPAPDPVHLTATGTVGKAVVAQAPQVPATQP